MATSLGWCRCLPTSSTTPPNTTVRDGVIWLTASRQDDRVVVSIRDNGPGIPQHMLKDIFELFHQVDDTVSRSHGGLGIGLTLVKQLVELHGGTVEALSEGPGKGSEFR